MTDPTAPVPPQDDAAAPTHITPEAAEEVKAHGLIGRVQHALAVGTTDAITEARVALKLLTDYFAKKDGKGGGNA